MSTVPRTSWTAEEDSLLRRAVAELGDEPGVWKAVAERIPGRTNKACRKRWLHSLSPTVKKTPWTPAEDELLLKYYTMHSPPRWSFIAKHIPGRTDDACSKRYREALDPLLKRDSWTDGEDSQLQLLAFQLENRWTQVGQAMGRSGLACRNRWRLLQRKQRPQNPRSHLPASITVLSHIDSSTHFIAPQGLTSYHVDNTLPIYGGQDASSFEEEAPPPPPISTISSLSNALVPATRARNVTEPISHSESPYTDEGPTLDSPLWVDQTSNTNVDFMLSGPDVDYDSSRTPSPELSLLPFNCAASLQYPTSVGQGQNILPAPLPPPSSELQTISSTASSSPFVPVISSSNLSASMSTTHSDRMPPEQHPSDPNPRPLKRPRLRRPHGRDQTRLSSHLPADSSGTVLPYACGHPRCWPSPSPDVPFSTPQSCFVTAAELAEHRRLEHENEETGDWKPYKCALEGCGKGWKNLNGIQYHLQISKSHFQAALGIGKKTTHDAQNENPSQSRHPPDGEATQTTTASTPPADLPLEDQPDPSASSNSSQHALSSSALSHPPPTSHPSLLVPSTNDQVLSFISPSISSSLPSAPSSHSLPIPPSNPSLFQTTSAPDPVSITNANPNTHVKSVRAYKRRPPKNLPCPVEGCPKVYKQKTGLMYHLEHGHPNLAQLLVIPPTLLTKLKQDIVAK